MQRSSITVSGIRKYCVTSLSSSFSSNHGTLTDHRVLKQVLDSCKAPLNATCVIQTHAQIFKLGYGTYPSLLASMITADKRCKLSYFARRLLLWFLSWSPGVSNTNLIIQSL